MILILGSILIWLVYLLFLRNAIYGDGDLMASFKCFDLKHVNGRSDKCGLNDLIR